MSMLSVVARRTSLLAVLVAAVGVLAQPAAAADPIGLARQCIEAVTTTASHTAERNRSFAVQTVRTIRSLDEQGAADRRIFSIADRGTDLIVANSQEGIARIRNLRSRCVDALQAADADRRIIAAVVNAADESIERIRNSSDNTRTRVRRAAAAATN